MTDRPILFSAPMVRALIKGRKTMTRRIAWGKPFGLMNLDDVDVGDLESQGYKVSGPDDLDSRVVWPPTPWQKIKPGDRLWVREAWAPDPMDGAPLWRADKDGSQPFNSEDADKIKWKPSIFMPRVRSRITLTVTESRVERLCSITEADAIAEGIHEFKLSNGSCFGFDPAGTPGRMISDTAVGAFENLWTRINGAGSWIGNPEVAAITVTVQRGNIDAVPKP